MKMEGEGEGENNDGRRIGLGRHEIKEVPGSGGERAGIT